MLLSQCTTRQVQKPRISSKRQCEPTPEFSISPVRLRRLFRAIIFSGAMFVCCAAVLCAQQPPSGQDHPDAPSATRSAQSASRKPPAGFFATLNRKSIVFPDIATTEGPLSTGGKFKLFVDNSVSLSSLAGSALTAGIGQAEDYPHGYGQGGEGYGKRFGATMARTASSEFFGTFLLASMLGQDPRFFPQRDPTFGGSVKYALTRVVVTRNDDGNDVANWSGLLGPLMAEGLANAYWPEEDRNAAETFRRYGVDLGTRAGFNMFRNYWPVLIKKIRH
jgi:hypothetical protein